MPRAINRRHALRRVARGIAGGGLAALGAGCAAVPNPAANNAALRLIGYGALPTTPQRLHGLPIGGLSALAYDPDDDLWWALSDTRGNHVRTRCFTFRLPPFAPAQDLAPRWQSAVFLQGPSDLNGRAIDPEGLALRRNPATGAKTLLWSSEGHVTRGVPPAIYESTLAGALLRGLSLPPLLTELGHRDRGPRNNRTLEGVAVAPGGGYAWAAMEGSLKQDATPAERAQRSAPRRITRFDLASGRADRQIAYLPDAFPERWWMPAFAHVNGLSDLLVASDDELWVLERAFNPALGFRVRLYAADLRGPSDTLGVDTLRPGAYRAAPKRLLVDCAQLGLPTVDNLEGMAWGPRLPTGERTLLLASDNNFNPLELTQFVALAAPPADAAPPEQNAP